MDSELVKTVAYVMCSLENRMRHRSLDAMQDEINRTWERHTKEANDLIEALANQGVTVSYSEARND